MEFLHGTLEATIFHATPYTPPFPLNCVVTNGKPAYVTIKIDNKKVAKTSSSRDRIWNQTFQILCAHRSTSTITISLKTSYSILGAIKIQACRLLAAGTSLIDGFFPLLPSNNPELKLRLMLWFKAAEFEASWERVIVDGFRGLRNAAFPLRSNCHVTLYQDAHHGLGFRPPVGRCGTPRRLWEDVYKAIEGAKCLVYIAGWSFNPNLVLVRDPETEIPHGKGVRIGELLRRKADEGVVVRIMLWDDETSLPLIRNAGLMRTYDEDALAYFSATKVVCKLCPRLHNNRFPTLFSHHQKTLTLDSIDGTEIVSFLGGLDFCDGRYDTDQHSLFHDLDEDDFYQTSIAGASLRRGGPREPWHDTHACVRGHAAMDILFNFEQRWAKQLDPSLLVPRRSTSELIKKNLEFSYNWNAQVFRSIDDASCRDLPGRVERSIHEAYVEAIRRAERFVYVENQYFMGGCHLWGNGDCSSGCGNLIPVEIALKIAAKIRVGERFSAYVVVPMWAEGVPESESVGDMLHWTRETMKMMYGLIGNAIRERGVIDDPRDYLSFFCLGNRESVASDGEFAAPCSPKCETNYWNSQRHRRFMIYVHSKLMIVDDLYLLIGSANINQRSMDGERDTEIAIGCYQPQNNARLMPNTNHQEIRKFRMSLWYEHTRLTDDTFLDPQSLECMRKMNSIGNKMWQNFSGEELVDMEGVHLMSYPIHVTQNGVVEDLGDGCFPDTNTPVKGKRSKILPPIFTT